MNQQELIWSAVLAWTVSKFMEFLKKISWLPMDYTTESANKWVARLFALLAAIGIHSTFDPQAGTLLITGLTPYGVLVGVGEYAKQFMLQEIAYKKFVREDNNDFS